MLGNCFNLGNVVCYVLEDVDIERSVEERLVWQRGDRFALDIDGQGHVCCDFSP
jgi:hypothetical protein